MAQKKKKKPKVRRFERHYPPVIWVVQQASGWLEAYYANPDDHSRPDGVPSTAQRYVLQEKL